MTRSIALWALLVVEMIVGLPAVAQVAGFTTGPRFVPPPEHVSPRLQHVLTEAPSPDVKAAKARVPTSKAAWKGVAAKLDAEAGETAERLARELGVTVKEERIGDVRVYRATPARIAPEHADHLVVVVHGGAFVHNGGLAGTAEAVGIAARAGVPTIAVDYRLALDHPAPAARDDVVTVWREVTKTHPAAATALAGSSAGGNLVLVTALRLKELGLPLPGALIVGTPVTDLAKSGDSRFLNEGVDRNLVTWDGIPAAAVELYAHGAPLDDPSLSPIFGDVAGFPPTYLVTGTRDLLLSDTVTMHRRLRRAGVDADLHVYEGQSHADYLVLRESAESKEHFAEVDAFLRDHLAR